MKYFTMIVLALEYAHHNGVAHAQLTADHVYLCSSTEQVHLACFKNLMLDRAEGPVDLEKEKNPYRDLDYNEAVDYG